MSDPIRFGIIGAGAIAQVAHLPLLSKLKDAEIVALCDTDLPKARALASRFGIGSVYDDIVDMFRDTKPDAVVVCTPNHLHEVHASAALSAGIHVLCERPVAMTSAGVQKLVADQKAADRVLMAGMNHRFRGDVQALREFLRGEELGELRSVRCGWYTYQPPDVLGWRIHGPQAGGGAMQDLGLPLIDLALWLADHPKATAVSSHLGPAKTNGDVEQDGCAFIRCEDGSSIFVDVSWNHVGDREMLWLDMVGSRGSAGIGPLRVFKEINGKPVNVTPTGASGRENAFTVSYRGELAHFVAAVKGEVEPARLDDQIELHRVVEAIRRSAAEGREVTL
ncbi:MAG: Gfo/Idh/MocA family oxidoreductase [Gemmatimonadota bacterium]|nr:MAG: Gfo/Idh/MocA family oxidoreductase [Gemmatimonadota bacterium]